MVISKNEPEPLDGSGYKLRVVLKWDLNKSGESVKHRSGLSEFQMDISAVVPNQLFTSLFEVNKSIKQS